MSHLPLADGLIVIVKRDCETCRMAAPVFGQLADAGRPLVACSQDDPTFPETVAQIVDDRSLEISFHLDIETVPTLIRVENGRETGRVVGWHRREWEALSGITGLGPGLPGSKPGCGALNVEPGLVEMLAVRFGRSGLSARQVPLAPLEDEIEAGFERGWSDGLPVVPPTPVRVLRMLQGTHRRPDEVIGLMPPNLVPITVEKAAINAVLAGCKPDYLPIVLAAISAACADPFNMHGVLATTYHVGPVVIVNGPVARKIGMNSGVNALGQGNRANATIGRALQLAVRNVGGGRPGEIDRAAQGNPGKYTFCFAEREDDTAWTPLAVERGLPAGASAVTLFAGAGVWPIADQKSRRPESLARSFAASLRGVCHPKLALATDAVLVVCPEHSRVFEAAGWSKARLRQELEALLEIPSRELAQGAGGIDEGMPDRFLGGETVPKFRPDGLLIARAGGTAGMFSAIISGWPASGPRGSVPVTVLVEEEG